MRSLLSCLCESRTIANIPEQVSNSPVLIHSVSVGPGKNGFPDLEPPLRNYLSGENLCKVQDSRAEKIFQSLCTCFSLDVE